MNCFLDTNVIIAYIFSLDNLNKYSKCIVFKSDNKYYSYNVKKEVDKVFYRKNFDFERFFSKVSLELDAFNDFELLSRSELQNCIDNFDNIGNFNVNDMHSSFEKMWNEFNFGENQEIFIIKLKLNDFIRNFEALHHLRKLNFYNEMILVPNHSKKNPLILDKIEKENLRELLHGEDENILFDLNEFCQKNRDLNLKFVSADSDFLNVVNCLIEELCISDCISLKEFNVNN